MGLARAFSQSSSLSSLSSQSSRSSLPILSRFPHSPTLVPPRRIAAKFEQVLRLLRTSSPLAENKFKSCGEQVHFYEGKNFPQEKEGKAIGRDGDWGLSMTEYTEYTEMRNEGDRMKKKRVEGRDGEVFS